MIDLTPSIAGFLFEPIVDPHEREDVVQDTLVALHRARHTYDPARPFEPWLFAIARHVLVDHFRRRGVRAAREVLVDVLPERAGDGNSDGAGLLEALARLPAAQREAFEMLKLEGLSVAAAAARAGTTISALKVRAHRAYKALRVLLGG